MSFYKTKKIFIPIFLLLFFLSVSVSRYSAPPDSEDTVSSSLAENSFDDFATELFKKEISSNTLNLHYTLVQPENFGIFDYEVCLGNYSMEETKENYIELNRCYQYLETVDSGTLDEKMCRTYDIFKEYIQTQLEGTEFTYYNEVFSPTIGTQAQLPILFAEFRFRSEKDIPLYLNLLSQTGDYYESLLEFEREKAAQGLFMSSFAVDDIVSQCEQFIHPQGEHYLISIFNEKLNLFPHLSEETKEFYRQKNQSIILTTVIPAYEKIIEVLTELKSSGTNDMGLCHFENGTAYYEFLVKSKTGSSKSIEELKTLLSNQFTSDFTALSNLVKTYPEILDSLDSYSFSLEKPEEILNDLQNKIKQDFPEPPSVDFQIKYVDPSLEKHISPAFYLTPAIDDISNNVIYINRANNYDNIELYTTLAHEGYPGHLYQAVCSAAADQHPLRSILNFGGYIEGWATYVEMQSYYYADIDQKLAKLLQLNNSLSLCLYSTLDIGIHYDGWDLEKAKKYLSGFGIKNEETAEKIYHVIVEEPANYLKYYIGCLEFLSLRSKAEKALGDKFSLIEFHKFILDIGPAPFHILHERLDSWIQNYSKLF